MKTYVHLWSYLGQLFLNKNVSNETAEKTKTHILSSMTFFFPKIVPFMIKRGKVPNSRKATDDSIIIRRMRFLCWVTKATDTHSEYEILIGFLRQQWVQERALMLLFYVNRLSCILYKAFASWSL
jgi:hypothetical protein